MTVIKLMLGDLQTNCYVMINEKNECVMIDPGSESDKLCDLIDSRKLTLKAILITHGHFDHIGGVNGLLEIFNVPVYAHENESLMMSESKLNLSASFNRDTIECEASNFVNNDDTIDIGNGFSFKVIEVPGHTSHSLCFLQDEGHLFTGDTLFRGTIGRTDLYIGNPNDLIMNIREKLLTLNGDIKVYPGHGLITNIKTEIDTNPFF